MTPLLRMTPPSTFDPAPAAYVETRPAAIDSRPDVPPLPDLPADAEGSARRRRGDLAQADGPGRADPADRSGAVDLSAGGVAGGAEDRGGDPRGDGGDRLPGDADAAADAGRALAEDRPLRDRGVVQARGPQGVADGAGDDPRGGGHHPCGAGGALLPRPAADALPDPDEG